ncbi:helix-turn-helix domain-containing protein [Limnoglobus roseus]|uniref:Uncharacterized protein n=1 Tax=Limnoglobus roseus TaxID=2598579 RepID=A0A5C1AJV5_9BACT|nr:helix-turn-helix domain-containing protein [Limnoglobus roseus]QEL18296.1 hypothetical protein PX52LOC_05315 [Limnoglobus roseus]
MATDADDQPLTPEHLAVEQRRLLASRLYLRGKSLREIADELGVSHTQVRRDLDAVRAEWLAEGKANVDEAVARQVARYEHLIALAYRAFDESRGTHVVTRTETSTGEKGGTKDSETKEEMAGDPRFIAEVRHCQEAIAKLKGYNAAIKVESTHKGVLAIDKALSDAV